MSPSRGTVLRQPAPFPGLPTVHLRGTSPTPQLLCIWTLHRPLRTHSSSSSLDPTTPAAGEGEAAAPSQGRIDQGTRGCGPGDKSFEPSADRVWLSLKRSLSAKWRIA